MPELFVVDADAEGQRLDEFLALRMHRLSRMRIAGLLAEGACRVGGAPAHAGWKLRAGDRVELADAEAGPNATTPEPLPVEIVYEDEQFAVVNKPAGMLAHPTRGVKTGTLANALAYHFNRELLQASAAGPPTPFVRPGIVHRLDRATSGLMVVARTQAALSQLARHFHRRLVEKRYLAIVHGPLEEGLTISAPVGRVAERSPAWGVTEAGRPAETRLRVVETRGRLTLVELEPVTGRTNQLRIHCAHVGHPIVGDEWYAPPGDPRLCLHASRLGFRHPADNAPLTFVSPLPSEIHAVFAGEATTGAGTP